MIAAYKFNMIHRVASSCTKAAPRAKSEARNSTTVQRAVPSRSRLRIMRSRRNRAPVRRECNAEEAARHRQRLNQSPRLPIHHLQRPLAKPIQRKDDVIPTRRNRRSERQIPDIDHGPRRIQPCPRRQPPMRVIVGGAWRRRTSAGAQECAERYAQAEHRAPQAAQFAEAERRAPSAAQFAIPHTATSLSPTTPPDDSPLSSRPS